MKRIEIELLAVGALAGQNGINATLVRSSTGERFTNQCIR